MFVVVQGGVYIKYHYAWYSAIEWATIYVRTYVHMYVLNMSQLGL